MCKHINALVNGVSNIPVLAKVKPWLRLEALMPIPGKDYTTDERSGGISKTSNHPDIGHTATTVASNHYNMIYDH